MRHPIIRSLIRRGSALVCAMSLLCVSVNTCKGESVQMKHYDTQTLTDLEARFADVKLKRSVKDPKDDAPVMVQRFGADPWALVFGDRVYLYMTGDLLEVDADGKITQNTYSQIKRIHVVSSEDLINWTDHGWVQVAGYGGAVSWGGNSWAPAVAHKVIDSEDRFFLYFANGGNGIGVLTADSPTGPFTDPLGKALVSRATPNCANVAWLFDPAVLVDEDGTGWLYFGGGIPADKDPSDPGTARVVRLGDDMISLAAEPTALDVPYLFEDSGINRIGDTYYYSYCTNWQVTSADSMKLGFNNAEIAYMTSDSPEGPFTLRGTVLRNPGVYFGAYGNNHHCIFSFRGEWYIAYHAQILEKPMNISGGYRSTCIARLNLREDGSFEKITTLTRHSLQQVGSFDPYRSVNAATMVTKAGIKTVRAEETVTCGEMVVTDIQSGDWLSLSGVDFADGAASFRADVRGGGAGTIQLRIDEATGPVIGYVDWDAGEQSAEAELIMPVSGTHDLFLIFEGEGYELVSWRFTPAAE